jgi:hypothetical protein
MGAQAIVLDQPIWFERLRAPRWLLPDTSIDAPRVLVACVDLAGAGDDPALGVGVAMMLAEGLRMSSDAAVPVATTPLPLASLADLSSEMDARFTVAVAVSAEDEGHRTWVRITDRDGGTVADLGVRAPDAAALDAALADLAGAVGAALSEHHISRTWAPAYSIPSAAVDYARAHRSRHELASPDLYPDTDDVEILAARRTVQLVFLRELADLAHRSRSRFAALLYMAGLIAVHDAGSDAHLEFRLQTNAICIEATDPRDVVFRMSPLVLRIQGDLQMAERRVGTLRAANDAALTEWLERTQAVR